MKIGILSFAHHHSEAYIANLRAIPGVEVCGVADEDASRGERFARDRQDRHNIFDAAIAGQKRLLNQSSFKAINLVGEVVLLFLFSA